MALLPNIVIQVTKHAECQEWAGAVLLFWKERKQQVPNLSQDSTEGWSQPGIWAWGCCLQELGRLLELLQQLAALNNIVDIAYVAEIYTFLLVKLILRCDNNSTSSRRKNCTDGHNNSDSKPTVKGSAARHFCSNEQQTGFGTSADATLDKDLASCQWRENSSKKDK